MVVDKDKAAVGLTVVIINWNNLAETTRCVEDVASWESIKPRIVVVDNGSRDGSARDLEARFPHVMILKSEVNLGFGGGNNLALKKALELRDDYILMLNNDASVPEGGISDMIRAMDECPEIGIMGPLLGEGSNIYAGGVDIGLHLNTRIAWSTGMGVGGISIVDHVPGAVLLLRRAVIEKAGLLDEEYFFSGEVADLCRRSYDTGMACGIDLCVEASHRVNEFTPLRDTLYVYYNLRNRFLYVKKHHRDRRLSLQCRLMAYCVRESLFSLAKGKIGRARAALLALADGMTGRFGDRNDWFITPVSPKSPGLNASGST